ncbi:MAG: hypothetical protein OEV64_11410 [Desulfobulbaceae bacterium]|nr:hypothetical protein [Desulfobulbaceae bacterium]
MIYLRLYKVVYILAVVINLFLRFFNVYGFAAGNDDSFAYTVNIFTIIFNIVGFVVIEKKFVSLFILEKILSFSRMMAIFIAASIVFAFLIVVFPTSLVIWTPLMGTGISTFMFWMVCALMMGLEIVYFVQLKRLQRDAQYPERKDGDRRIMIDELIISIHNESDR